MGDEQRPLDHGILWCAHVNGPDDVIATDSYEHAVELCRDLNAGWTAYYAMKGWGSSFDPTDAFAPRCFALPMIWPHDPEGHAQAVAEPSPDYASAFERARATARPKAARPSGPLAGSEQGRNAADTASDTQS